MDQPNVVTKPREPWNKGKLVGQKAPFKLKEIWAIRIRLQLANCARATSGHSREVMPRSAPDLVAHRQPDLTSTDDPPSRQIRAQIALGVLA